MADVKGRLNAIAGYFQKKLQPAEAEAAEPEEKPLGAAGQMVLKADPDKRAAAAKSLQKAFGK